MPEWTLDLSNLNLEFEVIAHGLQNGRLPEGVTPEIFAGSKARWIAEKIERHGPACTPAYLASELQREERENEIPEFTALVNRLLGQVTNREALPEAIERLKDLLSGRKLAELLSQEEGVAHRLKRQEVREAFRLLEGFIFSENEVQGVIDEGSFIADGARTIAHIEQVRLQEGFQGCPTYIPPLDDIIFGLLPSEYGLVCGGSGEGKSMTLSDIGMRNWEWGGKNVIGFTIEMKMLQQQQRQLAWALSIDTHRFRTGDITEGEMVNIRSFYEERADRENVFYWVDIPENINAAQIERKLLRTERRLGIEFDIVLIDYVGIMSPIEKMKSGRLGWDSQAAISWDVHNLARKTNKIVWSAAQKKENISDRERQRGGFGSIGLSYMIAQPTDICIVYIEHTLEGYMDANIAKGRDVPKDRLRLYPELRYARIHKIEGDPLAGLPSTA